MERLRRLLPDLRTRYGVEHIQVYGSVARGEAGPDSDVDLLVEFQRTPSLFEMARLQAELEGHLGRPVDLATPGGMRASVLAEARHDAVEVG